MANLDDLHGDQRRRLTDHCETFLHSLALLRGDRLSADQVSRIVGEAVAGASPQELRSSVPPTSAIDRLQQLLAQTVESGRPHNMYGAEAARAAQAAGKADDLRGGSGFGTLDAIRGSSARYRDLLPVSDSVKGGGSSGLSGSGGAMTSEFARSFAGTGIGGGTLRTFADVGLQRSVYDAYRQEGFSRTDIADAASTAKALDWKNDRQAFDDLQRSTKPQRAAIVEIDREKEPEKRDALIQHHRQKLHIDDLPQTAQDRWQRNIDRVQVKGHGVDRQHGVGARAKDEEAALRAETGSEKERPAMAKVRVAILTEGANKTDKAAAKQALDDFGVTAAPVKTAQAKPPAAGPTTG